MLFQKELNILKNDIKLIISIPIALILILFITLIRNFILIRFGLIHSDRIGHFAANTELYLCLNKSQKRKIKTIDFFYFPTKPCNNQMAIMIKRKLKVYPKFLVRPFCLITRYFKFLECHITGRPPMHDHDINNYYEKFKNQISLIKAEKEKGSVVYKKINPLNKPLVLLIIRDAKYLKKKYKNNSFEYHNHRDDDIKRYKSLVEHIIKQGYFVIRMGKIVKEKLYIKNENFLDYPFSNYNNDFMDIFLSYKCFMCISNVTGFDALPTIFRKPILFFGSIPVGFMSTSSKKFINTTYDHYDKSLKRNLSLKEIFVNGLDCIFKAEDFEKKNIILKKTNSKIMKNVFDETVKYIESNYKNINTSKKLNINFKNKYNFYLKEYSYRNSYNFHRKIRSYFPISWLNEKKYLIK